MRRNEIAREEHQDRPKTRSILMSITRTDLSTIAEDSQNLNNHFGWKVLQRMPVGDGVFPHLTENVERTHSQGLENARAVYLNEGPAIDKDTVTRAARTTFHELRPAETPGANQNDRVLTPSKKPRQLISDFHYLPRNVVIASKEKSLKDGLKCATLPLKFKQVTVSKSQKPQVERSVGYEQEQLPRVEIQEDTKKKVNKETPIRKKMVRWSLRPGKLSAATQQAVGKNLDIDLKSNSVKSGQINERSLQNCLKSSGIKYVRQLKRNMKTSSIVSKVK